MQSAVNGSVIGSNPITSVMKILFLDDSHTRWHIFKDLNPSANANFAPSYSQGIEMLSKYEYDVAFLDHDLDISHRTGEDVARYIVENKIPFKKIICHSMNEYGRKNMVSILRSAGYDAYEFQFAWSHRIDETVGGYD